MTSIFGRVFGGGRDTSGGSIQGQWDRISNYPGQFGGGDPKKNTPVDLASSGIYDELGYTRGIPGEAIAPDVQYGAGVVVAHRNDQLMASGGANAQAALQSGLENLQTYRPGGAAALLSGYYQSMANNYMATAAARRTEVPDLMFRYDERQRARLEKTAGKAAQIQTVTSLLEAAASLAGGMAGGAPGAAAPAMAGGAGAQTFPGGFGATVPGGTGSPAMVPGTSAGGAPQAAPQATPGATTAGAGGPQGGQSPSGQPGGGPRTPGGGQPAGGPKSVAPGAPGMGAAGGGGGAPQSGFPSPGPATTAMATRFGLDPAHMSALLDQVFGRNDGWISMMNARLNLLMARDSLLMAGAH